MFFLGIFVRGGRYFVLLVAGFMSVMVEFLAGRVEFGASAGCGGCGEGRYDARGIVNAAIKRILETSYASHYGVHLHQSPYFDVKPNFKSLSVQ